MIPFFAAATLKNLPWKNIILALVIAAVAGAILLYIRNAEQNRAAVKTLKAANTELVAANIALEASHKTTVDALQASITETLEREQKYAAIADEIRKLPDSGCGRNSLPLRAAVRLLGNNPSGEAGDSKRASRLPEAHPSAAAAR